MSQTSTRSSKAKSGQTDVMRETFKQFYEEFPKIVSDIVRSETRILENEIQDLRNEVTTLRESNIQLIYLLTHQHPSLNKIFNSESVDTNKTEGKGESSIIQSEINGNPTSTVSNLNMENKLRSNSTINRKENSKYERNILSKDSNEMASKMTKTNENRSSVKPRSTGITGSNTHITNFRAVSKKTEVFVSRLHPATTTDQIRAYLCKEFPEIECESLTSKYPENYASFKITVNADNYTCIMNPDVWPDGTFINKFFRKRRQPQTI